MDERMNEQTDEKQVMCTISSNGYHWEISLDRRLFPLSSNPSITGFVFPQDVTLETVYYYNTQAYIA